jgi:hypothetical protein
LEKVPTWSFVVFFLVSKPWQRKSSEFLFSSLFF